MSSRRLFLGQALCGCAMSLPGAAAFARVLPVDLAPTLTNDYVPADLDERGIWHASDELEQHLANSKLLIQNDGLTRYLTQTVQGLVEGLNPNIRVYPVWDPAFNASMFPNGMMVVHSGFLARVRNEAQLAAVLGHECGHYLRQHSLKRHRSARNASAAAAFIAIGGGIATVATGTNLYNLTNSINLSLAASVFSYTRDQESEADAFGLQLIGQRGYPPEAAAQVWAQLIEEKKASAAARKQKYKEGSSSFSTHPPNSARMMDLEQTAEQFRRRSTVDGKFDDHRRQLLDVLSGLRPALIEEQVKLNDPGANLYLINSLAQDGWDGTLRYYEGEVYRLRGEDGDAQRAASAYAAALAFPDAPPESYRQHGYALLKQGLIEDGKQSLRRYLELRPEAGDAQMIFFTLNQ